MRRTMLYALMCPMAACFTFASCQRTQTPEEKTSPTIVATMSAAPAAAPSSRQTLAKPEDLNGRFSYTYGYLLFQTLTKQGFDDLDAQYFAQGAIDAKEGSPLFTQSEMEETLRTVQQRLLSQAKDEYDAIAARNQEDAETFFAENGEREGVESLENGIQYQILDPGDTSQPTIGLEDTVAIDYTVSKLDGTFILGTSQRGHSDVFSVDTLSSGFLKEGIQLLHPGAHYVFWVPYQAVIDSGYIPQLEPNAAVKVDLEIKDVRYAAAAE